MLEINSEQILASTPTISAWVSASAGSGKTKVLTDRVLNLMLMSGEPEKILCLTFTKVAAAEMANRLMDILKNWSMQEEDQLKVELKQLLQTDPSSRHIQRARNLFTKVLEVPGGLKMMTIHSFCTTVLHRFPIEANVPPNFIVLDDLTANQLMKLALNEVLNAPENKDDILFLANFISQEELLSILNNSLKERVALFELKNQYSGIDGIVSELNKYFKIDNYLSEEHIITENFKKEEFPLLVEQYIKKTDGEIKKKYLEERQAQTVWETLEKIKAFKLIQTNKILLKLTFKILEAYQQYKLKQFSLDYDDLIDKTLKLLSTSTMSSWVLYKLDGGIDHILVDEAQDTNPKQWQIIAALTDDFFSGKTKNEKLRTLFVVGDKKQSIYSFQGARPDEFEKRHQFFKEKITASQNIFKTIPFNFSFRSTGPILDLVNSVLKNPEAANGVVLPDEDFIHLGKRQNDAGLVEIWPLENPPQMPEIDSWHIKRLPNKSAMVEMAQKIAQKISSMIQHKEILESKGRPIQAGDFLILLQKRGQLMNELVRSLKEYNVPVAGVDRLALTEHIAIQDLLNLVRFVLLPTDDLNMASLLKSPLINLNEEDVFKVCYDRNTRSVWERVQHYYPQIAATLQKIMNLADFVSPFEFFETVLNEFKGRSLFMARLGNEVNEALDAFLDICLQFEHSQTPSLQSFLSWMSKQDVVIKRDMEQHNMNAVRIMTVHGSKGLQGNIVFLPDTRGIKKVISTRDTLIWSKNNLPIWVPNKKEAPYKINTILSEVDFKNEQEKKRLLYVALTRASDRLYIMGYNNRIPAQKNNWYDLILSSLHLTDLKEKITFTSSQKTEIKNKEIKTLKADFNTVPSWVNTPPENLETQKIISPSKLVVFEKEETNLGIYRQALERGIFIHKLLQYLPQIPASQRKDIILKLTPPNIQPPLELADLLNKPELQALFGPNSAAEVPIIGILNDQKISGQVDRLVIKEQEVMVIDYKTNKLVPNDIPKNYQAQLNAYKALLKKIFPDRIVRTFLLWTETLTLVEVK